MVALKLMQLTLPFALLHLIAVFVFLSPLQTTGSEDEEPRKVSCTNQRQGGQSVVAGDYQTNCNFYEKGGQPSFACSSLGDNNFILTGTYKIFYINCTAGFPLNFSFDGITTTEDLDVNFFRLRDGRPNDKSSLVTFDVSVAIFGHVPNKSDDLWKQARSRSGRYTFAGFTGGDHADIGISYNLFFEEPTLPCPEFIKGPLQKEYRFDEDEKVIPCRTTHSYAVDVSLCMETIEGNCSTVEDILGYSPWKGFTLGHHSKPGVYNCTLRANGECKEDTMEITIEDCPEIEDSTGEDDSRMWKRVLQVTAFVAVTCALIASLYMHYFKRKRGGLTNAEIAEFKSGSSIFCIRGSFEIDEEVSEFTGSVPYKKELEVPRTRFQIDKTSLLGSGAFGIVYKGLLDGRPVAVKTVKRDNADSTYTKSLLFELKAMCHLGSHENLVELLGAYTADLWKGVVFLFVDYCPLGSLETYLRQCRSSSFDDADDIIPGYSRFECSNSLECSKPETITLKDLHIWSTQIAKGMSYLSSKKVIHGDLAARNVLLTDYRTVKITDFGLSRKLYDYAEFIRKKEERLPWRWLALESMKDLTFSTKSDVWSYGVTLWEIFSMGETPYPTSLWGLEFITAIDKGMRLTMPKHASPAIFEVMLKCWNSKPELRPSFDTIMKALLLLSKSVKTTPVFSDVLSSESGSDYGSSEDTLTSSPESSNSDTILRDNAYTIMMA